MYCSQEDDKESVHLNWGGRVRMVLQKNGAGRLVNPVPRYVSVSNPVITCGHGGTMVSTDQSVR